VIQPAGKSTELVEAGIVDPAARDHHMAELGLGSKERLFPHEAERKLDAYLNGEHGEEEIRLTGGRNLPDTEQRSTALRSFPPLSLLGELLPGNR